MRLPGASLMRLTSSPPRSAVFKVWQRHGYDLATCWRILWLPLVPGVRPPQLGGSPPSAALLLLLLQALPRSSLPASPDACFRPRHVRLTSSAWHTWSTAWRRSPARSSSSRSCGTG